MNFEASPTGRAPARTELLNATCDCASHQVRALADPARRMSSHRTSLGHVVYYRCYCDRPGVALMQTGPRTGE
jgi:hypothetical protein